MDFFDEIAGIAATQGDGEAARRLSGYNRQYKKFCTESQSDQQQDALAAFTRANPGKSALQFCVDAFNAITDPAKKDNYNHVAPGGCKELLTCSYAAPVNRAIPTGPNSNLTCNNSADLNKVVYEMNKNTNSNGTVISDDEARDKVISQLGENRSTVCGSLDNSGSAIGKALMDAAGTAAEAYIQTQSVRTQ
jgi:hypothetical protein